MSGQSDCITGIDELSKTPAHASPGLDARWREILYFVLVVPTVLSATDAYLLAKCAGVLNVIWLGVTFSWFCLQTAFVANWVGHRLGRSRWWWGILAWTLLLINIQVFAIASPENYWINPAKMLGFAFISGQAGLVVVWCILGTGSWRLRVPLIVSGIALTISFGIHMENEAMLYLMVGQILATAGCCAILRWTGFRFARMLPYSLHAVMEDKNLTQFSIRHLFFWTTTVGITAGIARWVNWSALFVHFQTRDLPYFLWYTTVLAVVSMFAAWIALGRENGIVRWLLGAVMLPIMGVGAGFFDKPTTGWRVFQIVPYWADGWQRMMMWAVWTSLAGLFLAGILLVFRAYGLRLVQVRKPKSNIAHVNAQSVPAA